MDAVVKVGGSFQTEPLALKNLCRALEKASTAYRILIVPGGGKFADLIRIEQRERGMSNKIAHLMAILGMNIFGYELHGLIQGSTLTDSLETFRSKGCPIFLPLKELMTCQELEPSWEVTSDTIAAWTSAKIGCKKLVLVKMVDGISYRGKFLKSVSHQRLGKMKQSVVDRKLPDFLEGSGITCWIVNGCHPDRVRCVLDSGNTVSTIIS